MIFSQKKITPITSNLFFCKFWRKILVQKQFWTFIFVLFFHHKTEKSQKYGWCKVKLLEIITTLITSNLFFVIFWREIRPPKNKNAQEKAVHFFFWPHVPHSNSEKKYIVGVKYML